MWTTCRATGLAGRRSRPDLSPQVHEPLRGPSGNHEVLRLGAGHAAEVGHREELQVPAAAKGWGGPSSWRDVEGLLAAALAQVAVRTPAGEGFGVTLARKPDEPVGGVGAAGAGRWSWTVGIPVPGIDYPPRLWRADDPLLRHLEGD